MTGKDLKVGDIIYIDGRSKWNLLGRAIRIIENGGKHPDNSFMPNHIGVVIETSNNLGEVKIIQSAFIGVRIKKLKLWVSHKNYNTVFKRFRGALPHWKLRKLKMWFYSQDGAPYDWFALVPIFIRFILLEICKNKVIRFFLSKIWQNPFDSKIKFFCSELVYRGFECIGIIVSNEIPGFVTPYDIYKNKRFRTIDKLFNYKYKKIK